MKKTRTILMMVRKQLKKHQKEGLKFWMCNALKELRYRKKITKLEHEKAFNYIWSNIPVSANQRAIMNKYIDMAWSEEWWNGHYYKLRLEWLNLHINTLQKIYKAKE